MNSSFLPLLSSFLFLYFLSTGQQVVLGSAHHRHHHHHHHHHHHRHRHRHHHHHHHRHRHRHHHHHHHHEIKTHHHLFGFRPTKLFVFGDSYSDTGNDRKSLSNSWKYPYGITFPGKPTGRFSDGRVFTDFLAKFVGLKSPIPYQWRKVGYKHLKYGMNFAYGGTGVFDTLVSYPNMTTQIDFFEELLKESVYTTADLNSSLALVTVSGNDYSAYIAINGSAQGFPSFIASVVNQMSVNLKRIYELGVKKIAVTGLQPLGCLPQSTGINSFQSCNGSENSLVNLHNMLLQQAVSILNIQTSNSTFVILDLYTSFMSVFENKGNQQGSVKFENPLKPCCVGISSEYSCGNIENGENKYTICDDPDSSFFWDTAHPTQQGWSVVYSALQTTLQQLVN